MTGNARCTVATEPADLPQAVFDRTYRGQGLPVVVRNATLWSGARFRAMTTLEALAADWGDRNVTLSSANAFSYVQLGIGSGFGLGLVITWRSLRRTLSRTCS